MRIHAIFIMLAAFAAGAAHADAAAKEKDMPEKIRLHWEGPFSQQTIARQVRPAAGLYQFYGHHPVYGEDVLLYIGKADNLKQRLLNHEFLGEYVPAVLRPETITVRVAYINEAAVGIEIIEGLLIFRHSPAWNSEYIRDAKSDYCDLEIYSEGAKGRLLDKVPGREVCQ